MQVLEQILEEIDQEKKKHFDSINPMKVDKVGIWCFTKCAEIIRSHMEDDGWIPVESEEKPPTKGYIYLSFANFDLPMVGRYEEDEEGGAFYVGDDEESCISQDMIVNAWKPIDKPYRPKEEER